MRTDLNSRGVFKLLRYIIIYGALLFLVIVNFAVLPYVKDLYMTKLTVGATAQVPFCFENGTTSLVDEGSWVSLPGLTAKDYRERAELDRFIRRANEWAPMLHRPDLRCGKNVPIPGYRLFSQCNPEGPSPCCNLKTGLCGIGVENCECENCTDFRKMVSAELARWQPKNCQLKRLHWQESCALISHENISLVFLGDSLIRHIHTATFLYLTNNYETGAIPQNASNKNRQHCSGVLQIIDKECSLEVAAQNVAKLHPGTLCPGFTPDKFTIDLVQDYHRVLLPEVRDKINAVLNQRNTWLILGVGLHYQLEMDSLKQEYLDKVYELLSHSTNGWPKVLWVELHAFSGYIRQVEGPTMKRIRRFNRLVEEYLEKRGAKVIKTFEMTKDVKSYDGRHHGLGLNLLKVDLIMNFLQQFYRRTPKDS